MEFNSTRSSYVVREKPLLGKLSGKEKIQFMVILYTRSMKGDCL